MDGVTYLFLLTMHVGIHVVIILNSINISVLLMLGSTFLAAGLSMLGIACQTML